MARGCSSSLSFPFLVVCSFAFNTLLVRDIRCTDLIGIAYHGLLQICFWLASLLLGWFWAPGPISAKACLCNPLLGFLPIINAETLILVSAKSYNMGQWPLLYREPQSLPQDLSPEWQKTSDPQIRYPDSTKRWHSAHWPSPRTSLRPLPGPFPFPT